MAIRRYDIGGPEDGALHVGEWWSATFSVDLTTWAGWTAKAQIRAAKSASSAVLVELACDTSVAGQVTVSLPAGETAVLGAFTGYWDLLVKPAVGDGQYIAEGTVTVTDLVSFTNTFPQPGTWARVGASVATNTAGANHRLDVPMETLDLAANNVAPICGRWYWAGWAASGNPATFKFRPYDTVFGVTVTTVYGDTLDAGFDSTALVWMGMIHNTNAALNNFYPLTQTKLNALAAQFGFSEDTNPDAGVHRWGGDDLRERADRC